MADESDDIIEMMHFDNDEEWEAMMRGMSDEECIAYVRRMYEVIAGDPEKYPGPTPEMLEQMRKSADEHEKACRAADLAEQRSRIAKARLDATANAMLIESAAKKTKGH